MICVISPGVLSQNALKRDGTSCLQILKIDKLPGKAVNSLIQGFTAVIHYITASLHSCIISNYYQFLKTYILKAFLVCSSSNRRTISTSVTSIYDLIHDRNLMKARLNVCRVALLCLNSLDSEPIKCSYLNFNFLTES